jgi:hypothetical protein
METLYRVDEATTLFLRLSSTDSCLIKTILGFVEDAFDFFYKDFIKIIPFLRSILFLYLKKVMKFKVCRQKITLMSYFLKTISLKTLNVL